MIYLPLRTAAEETERQHQWPEPDHPAGDGIPAAVGPLLHLFPNPFMLRKPYRIRPGGVHLLANGRNGRHAIGNRRRRSCRPFRQGRRGSMVGFPGKVDRGYPCACGTLGRRRSNGNNGGGSFVAVVVGVVGGGAVFLLVVVPGAPAGRCHVSPRILR